MVETLIDNPSSNFVFFSGHLDGALCQEDWIENDEVIIGVKCLLYEIENWSDSIPRWVPWKDKKNPDLTVKYRLKDGILGFEGKVRVGS